MRLMKGCRCSRNEVWNFGWTKAPDPRVVKMEALSRTPSDGCQCGGSSVHGSGRGGEGRGSPDSWLAEY